MHAFDVNNPYFRTKVLTAGPEELRLLLIEGALRFMTGGRQAMVKKEWEQAYENLSRAKEIIMELIGSLRPEILPELCTRLAALYTYMFKTLTEASLEKAVAKVDEVISLMEYERETWLMLMKEVAANGGAASGNDAAASSRRGNAGDDEPPPRARLSISA